ncbi:MAG: zinc-ribbon domain-containing protein [Azonexus sp.]|nr:zinc-ribbon domain-containing protein [Azonexus sp.]
MKAPKSNQQRREEIKAARRERLALRLLELERQQAAMQAAWRAARRSKRAGKSIFGRRLAVDYEKLVPNNSYGMTDFARLGFYEDLPFICADCGAECIWTAERQRWWYEVAGGSQYTTAKRCAACRAKAREAKKAAGRPA